MTLAGLPLHPLVIHLTLALVPLSILLTWAFALVRSWRWLTRWGALLLTAAGLAAVVVTRASGQDLRDDRYPVQVPPPVELHQDRAGVLLWVYVAFAVLVVLAFVLLPAPTGLASGRGSHPGRSDRWVLLVMPAALVVAGAVALVWLVLTGDAGARSVWS